MSDIVERLRKLADRERPYGSLPDALDEAADEITRLRARVAELEEALRWYAGDDNWLNPERARAALAKTGESNER